MVRREARDGHARARPEREPDAAEPVLRSEEVPDAECRRQVVEVVAGVEEALLKGPRRHPPRLEGHVRHVEEAPVLGDHPALLDELVVDGRPGERGQDGGLDLVGVDGLREVDGALDVLGAVLVDAEDDACDDADAVVAAGDARPLDVGDALTLVDVVEGRLVERLDADEHAREVRLGEKVEELGVLRHVGPAKEERLLKLEVLRDHAAADLLGAVLVGREVVVLEVHVLEAPLVQHAQLGDHAVDAAPAIRREHPRRGAEGAAEGAAARGDDVRAGDGRLEHRVVGEGDRVEVADRLGVDDGVGDSALDDVEDD